MRDDVLLTYRRELQNELERILDWWMKNSVDHVSGGYLGSTDDTGQPMHKAPKGIVLNSRILWSFSAAFLTSNKQVYREYAQRACNYILHYFTDVDNGGVYWMVDHLGAKLNARKQTYGLAFCLYGMAEYYKAVREPAILDYCVALFHLMDDHCYDPLYGGYFEAFSEKWEMLDDVRLSDKDANEPKTMNTHLHVMEAFTNLYLIWPDKQLQERISNLVRLFCSTIQSTATGHLNLFFDHDWCLQSGLVSYGHDIEAAWMLPDTAHKISEQSLYEIVKRTSLKMIRAAMKGLGPDGGLSYEFDYTANELIHEKHWWPQAEAMIGFFYGFEITGEERYLNLSLASWDFVKANILDMHDGEWFWGVTKNLEPMVGFGKSGPWKGPYHNSRACIELMARIDRMVPR